MRLAPVERLKAIGLLLTALVLASGCDLQKFAANQTVDVFKRGGQAFNEAWDYELARAAAPAGIMQLEGLYRVADDNQELMVEIAKAYCGYAYGFVEDDLQAAVYEGAELEKEDAIRSRGRMLYMRARNVAFAAMEMEEEGLQASLEKGLEAFQAYLKKFDDAEDHTPMLFWGAYGWGASIKLATATEDAFELVADVAFARVMMERAVELNPNYFSGSGPIFLGTLEATSMGGDMEKARRYFEQALELTNRKAHQVHLNYAESYAVKTGNRELFDTLIAEILAAEDVPDQRMANKIAYRRAKRLAEHADELF